MCTVYSEMKKHEIGLQYVTLALEILEKLYSELMIETQGKLDANFVQVMATAYHNAGVEYEFLRQDSESLIYFQKAVKMSTMYFGEDS